MPVERFAPEFSARIADRLRSSCRSPRESATAVLIIAVALVTTTDVLLLTPTLPAMRAAFGVSEPRVSLVVTVYAIPSVVAAPLVGYLADRVGRRRILAACLAVFGVAGASITLAGTFRTVLLLRAIQGTAAGSILASLALTLVADHFDDEGRDTMMGMTAAAISIGAAVYPTIGGYLSTFSWRAPFAVYGICVPLAPVAYVVLARKPTAHRSGGSYLVTAMRELPVGRLLRVYGLLALGFVVMFGGIYVLLPLFLRAEFGLGPAAVGLVSSFVLGATAVASTQSGRLQERFDRRERLVIGFGAFGLGTATVGIGPAIPLFAIGLVSIGVGLGVMTPTLFVVVTDLAPERFRAGVMSLRTTTVGVSQTIGPIVFTESSRLVGYRPVFVAGGIAMAAVSLSLFRRR